MESDHGPSHRRQLLQGGVRQWEEKYCFYCSEICQQYSINPPCSSHCPGHENIEGYKKMFDTVGQLGTPQKI